MLRGPVGTPFRAGMKSIDKRVIAGGVLGLGLSVWFVSSIEWGPLVAALGQIDPVWIGLSVLFMVGEWVLRGLRWAVLIRHLDEDAPLGAMVSATFVGAALNTLIPLRGGDFVRPAVLARARNLPYTTVFSTTILERLLDILGILVVLGVMIVLLPAGSGDGDFIATLKGYGVWLAVMGILAVLLALLLGTRRARDTVQALLRPLPEGVRGRMLAFFDELVVGLAVAGNPARLIGAILATFAVWAVGLCSILALFQAFDLSLPVSAALFVEGAIALSVAIPQAPGFVGVFHVVMEKTLTLWDTPSGSAQAAALVFWAVSFVPITLIGLVEAWRQGLGITHPSETLLESLEAREREGSAPTQPARRVGP